jgi:hypothetical protein
MQTSYMLVEPERSPRINGNDFINAITKKKSAIHDRDLGGHRR